MADDATYYTDTGFAPPARYIPVALAADRLATRQAIDRAALDEVALRSQAASAAAEEDARLTRSRIDAGGLSRDECIRPDLDLARLQSMPPAFEPLRSAYADAWGDEPFDFRHSVAHAPPMCDGAGLAMLSSSPEGARARILSYAQTGG